MSQKIMNIKNILKIIISVFIIFSLIKSCSNAWTIDDFIAYSQEIHDKNISAGFNHQTNLVITYQNNIRNAIGNLGYTGFVLNSGNSSTGYARIILYNTNLNFGAVNDNDLQSPNPAVSAASITINQNTGNVTIAQALRITAFANSNSYGLVENNNITNWKNNYFNGYEPPPKIQYTPYYDAKELTINNITDVYGQQLQWTVGTRLGKITNYYEIDTNLLSYNLKNYKTQEEIPIELQFVDRETMVIKVVSNSSVFKNQLYDLTIQYDDKELHYFYYLYGTDVNIVNGQTIITNFSGDSDYNIQNATNDNQKFTEKIIDDLFKIDETEIQEIIENIKNNVHVENLGMVSGETQILNILKGEPSDFVISWNSTEYMRREIIPAGQINFSERIRQTPQLETVVNWARIIIGYATISVLIMEIWFTLCRILGISISFYEQQHDEIDSISEYTNDFYDTDTGILTRDIVRKRKGYVQTLRQRKDFNPKNRKR